jgi:hypothetical protein
MLMVAAAAIIGVLNLVFVHADKIRRREKGNLYSAILIIFLFGTFILGLILPPSYEPGHEIMRLILNGVILPVEAALMGILTITLLYAAARLLRRRADFTTIVFLITAVLVFFGSMSLPFISGVSLWIREVLAVGGARGILIGVSLGTLLTGLRVLFGIDRPYGGN